MNSCTAPLRRLYERRITSTSFNSIQYVMLCNVMDTIFWLSPSIESCNWIDFIFAAYASWYHWNCGWTQRKAATINQLACPSYSLNVQLLWYPMYYPGGIKARVSPVQWLKPHSILAPTQDSNPGFRIQNHKRWPLHYHCTYLMLMGYHRPNTGLAKCYLEK